MSYLVDTQALVWFVEGNPKLKPKARKVIEDPSIPVFTSIASIWEMGIKISINKLQITPSLPDFVAQLRKDNIVILDIQPTHVFQLLTLPHLHNDPFDRIIIAQAMVGGWEVITSDEAFKDYPVTIFWW